MTRNTKLLLMFVPLALFAVGLALLVDDMRHPAVDSDTCMVIALGPVAGEMRTPENTLYATGNNPAHNVAFNCERRGIAILNDMDVIVSDLQAGNGAVLTHRQYSYLPDRWHVDITTPEEAKK